MYLTIYKNRKTVYWTNQDAQRINDEIKQENEEFLQRAVNFNKINMGATARTSDFCNDLFDILIDLSDSRQIIDDALTTEDICRCRPV